MENGEWQGEDSTCIETAGIRCPILENSVNGRVIMSNGFGGGACYIHMQYGLHLEWIRCSDVWNTGRVVRGASNM